MRNRSYLFLLFVVALSLISGWAFMSSKAIFGLDIKGGTRITYRMKLEKQSGNSSTGIGGSTSKSGPTESEIAGARTKIISVLTNRASGMGAAEPVIAAKGADQIIVELPGVTDIDAAKAQIGSSARIELYHAATVRSPQRSDTQYSHESGDTADPVVYFRSRASNDLIKPRLADGSKNPAYEAIIRSWGPPILAGDDLAEALAEPAGADGFRPSFRFSLAGADKLGRFSEKYFGKEENIAFVLDGVVLSLTHIEKTAKLSDNAYISGSFSPSYTRNLTNLLNGGSLPIELEELGSEVVNPTIGSAAYEKMLVGGVISFVVIALFLIAYYSFPGFVALIALALYTLFTLTVLKLMGATFSLAAIAGFILSVGMAVDANILVFERFKEEMKAGKSLTGSLELGFKRAFSAIFDSNMCTIITSFVLANMGTGPVKGFAITLIVGVAISLFTAVTVTRSLLIFLVGSGLANNPKWYALDRNWFAALEKKQMHIVDKPRMWFIISLVTVLIGVPFAFMGGFKLNVEFTGGTEAGYAVKAPVNAKEIVENLEKAGLKGSNVKSAEGAKNQPVVYITVPPSKVIDELPTDEARKTFIAEKAGIKDATAIGLNKMGPTLSREVQIGAVNGVVVSSLLIVVYLALRFGISVGGFAQGLKFGLSAILALVHDILVVVFLAAIFGFFMGWEVSALFLTAMLTIIGFSVHDTIVIFDRIRENLRRAKVGEDLAHLMNESIRQSFARSLNTSSTVIATLVILIFFGTTLPDLKFFMTMMLFGILSGTYSSIFNASPILYLWDKASIKRNGEAAGLVGHARAEMAKDRMVTTRVEERTATNTSEAGRTYGQVRRRANQQVKDSWQEID